MLLLLFLFHVTGISYNKYPYFLSFSQVDHNSFYDNLAISQGLIGRGHYLIRVQTLPWKWCDVGRFLFLFLVHSIFLRNFNRNGHENCQWYRKKQINNNFPCSVLLSTTEMTSNCSNFCSETTCMRLVFPHEFWTFSCQSYLVPPYLPISLKMDTQLAVKVLAGHMLALKFMCSFIGFLEVKLYLTVFGMEFQLILALRVSTPPETRLLI